jgi:hypothetical protein
MVLNWGLFVKIFIFILNDEFHNLNGHKIDFSVNWVFF